MVIVPVNRPPTESGVLVVEGQDDKHVVWQLCNRHSSAFDTTRSGDDLGVTLRNHHRTFHIREAGSRSELVSSIHNRVMSSQLQPIGFLIDADDDLKKCWNDVVGGFERTGVQLPPGPAPGGTILLEQGFSPRIGIWILPDNKSLGELEDFVLGMIPPSDAVWPLSLSYIDNIPKCERKYTAQKSNKAKVFAWLATRKDPGRAGAAIGAGDLSVNGPDCQDFLTWLTTLFS